MERWQQIRGYEGWYEVSDKGNVRSIDRFIHQRSRYGETVVRHIRGKLVKPTDNGNGYLIVGLRKNQERRNFYVHRLVAEAFVENPNGYEYVNHLDYNRKNNSAFNLEWTTLHDNVLYSVCRMCKPKENTKPTNTGEKYIIKKRNGWRLIIQRKDLSHDRTYKTLEDAIYAREVLIGGGKHYAV